MKNDGNKAVRKKGDGKINRGGRKGKGKMAVSEQTEDHYIAVKGELIGEPVVVKGKLAALGSEGQRRIRGR